jgi:hypothetical protein
MLLCSVIDGGAIIDFIHERKLLRETVRGSTGMHLHDPSKGERQEDRSWKATQADGATLAAPPPMKRGESSRSTRPKPHELC